MRTSIITILLILPLWNIAQTLSIEDLWQNLDRSAGQQQRKIEVQLREAELTELRQGRLPVLYGEANVQRNIIIPVTPVPAIAFDPDAAEGAIVPLKFSTKWSSKAGLQAEWKIFDPKHSISEKEKELAVRRAQVVLERDSQDWRRDATLAYVAVVLASHQYDKALQDSSAYAEILAISKARHEAGRETSAEYIAAQQEMERKRIQLHESWSVLLDADLELRKYADLDSTTHLTSDIDAVRQYLLGTESNNYDIEALEIDRQISELRLRQLRRELLPTLTVNGYLGGHFYSNEFRLDRREEWFGNSFVNLALRIPISGYFTTKPIAEQLRLNVALSQIQVENERSHTAIADQQRAVRIAGALRKVDHLKHIESLAQQLAKAQRLGYNEGRVLLSEYNRSLLGQNQASRDLWQAEYDLIAILVE